MMVEFSYKFRIYPNAEQKIQLAKTFGCCRFVYNHFLDDYNNLGFMSKYNKNNKCNVW